MVLIYKYSWACKGKYISTTKKFIDKMCFRFNNHILYNPPSTNSSHPSPLSTSSNRSASGLVVLFSSPPTLFSLLLTTSMTKITTTNTMISKFILDNRASPSNSMRLKAIDTYNLLKAALIKIDFSLTTLSSNSSKQFQDKNFFLSLLLVLSA